MVSSDFGKLEVMRHLISGEDCAIAGEATAAIAAPVAETFRKSRRFILKTSPCWGVSHFRQQFFGRRFCLAKALLARSLTWNFSRGIRDQGMTALCKRKSNIGPSRPSF